MPHKDKKKHPFLKALKVLQVLRKYHHSVQPQSGRIPLQNRRRRKDWKSGFPSASLAVLRGVTQKDVLSKLLFQKRVSPKSCECSDLTAQIPQNTQLPAAPC